MTQSPYELRHNMLHSLIHATNAERCLLQTDLPMIAILVEQMDCIISGNPIDPIGITNFQRYIESKSVQSNGRYINMQWKDWYTVEFNRINATIDCHHQPAAVEAIVRPRGCGITTFIVAFAAYMQYNNYDVVLVSDDKRAMTKVATDMGEHNLRILDADDVEKSITIRADLVITDIWTKSVVEDGYMSALGKRLSGADYADIDDRPTIFQYTQIEF